ncbi:MULTISPECIES: FGGY-family carbohydrate kinase [Pedobacter]|uniref:FGGY-family carbohydrate kinase n=1 Tax=Pedobacter TaxID=84567 RepID=UPI0010D02289|nr:MULTISPECIES: FGGY-family carbohydrate kinase [Pedobacter]RYD78765.1 MAG: carbohydrate kinase [Sphingobacteriales bacterium]
MEAYFLGVDVGTQGARVVLLSHLGELLGEVEEVFPISESSRAEQSPKAWWISCRTSLQKLLAQVKVDKLKILAISVTSTSGTVIPLDVNNEPLHDAIMYSDKRSALQGEICTAAALKFHNKGFTSFNSSSGLAKMLWFIQNYPEKANQIAKWVHAADYITGKLSNEFGITDYTNAFKSGYDVGDYYWPNYVSDELGIKKEWLPQVVSSGTIIGKLIPQLASEWGLSQNVAVTAGITDGCASQIASGAMEPGDWNTTIGTTMVIKGVTKNEITDQQGRIYSHRHPAGYWMPGGASNTGADWVSAKFGNDLKSLNEAAAKLIPTGKISYPLIQKGERFPIMAPQAYGFEDENLSEDEKFTANMEGVAYLERYAFELISHLSGEEIKTIYTAGGGSKSDVWLKIRANVMRCPIVKMKYVSGAVGAAILAASAVYFDGIMDAAKKLTVIDKEFFPELALADQYDVYYREFTAELVKRDFIKQEEIYA